MADGIKGPASYFPSIEAKYGRPISEWKALPFGAGDEAYGTRRLAETGAGLGHGHANALVADTPREDKR